MRDHFSFLFHLVGEGGELDQKWRQVTQLNSRESNLRDSFIEVMQEKLSLSGNVGAPALSMRSFRHAQPRRPRYPLSTADTYGAIYILPNILSSREWPEARAKLLNIQRGNEAKFVCVSSRRRYTFGSSTVALLTESRIE